MAVTLTPILDIPMVRPGDDLAGLLIAACERNALAPADGDVLVVAQKIVSKAEGRYVDLAKIQPSPRAASLAIEVNKDPRLVEVILAESRRVVRQRPGVLIVEHRLGFIMANAGVDRSNIDPDVAAEPVLLLPSDPDASAAGLRTRLAAHFRARPGVIVTDSWGRAWRRRTAGADGHARSPRSVRARAACHPNRIRRRDRQRRVAHHGASGRGAADGAGARPQLVGTALARRRADPLGRRGLVPVSAAGHPPKTNPPKTNPPKTLVVALCGGIGGAKLALGLSRVVPGADLMVVANTGDDFEHLGLAISPDLDTVMYTLAGLADPRRGWGRRDETWTLWPRSR